MWDPAETCIQHNWHFGMQQAGTCRVYAAGNVLLRFTNPATTVTACARPMQVWSHVKLAVCDVNKESDVLSGVELRLWSVYSGLPKPRPTYPLNKHTSSRARAFGTLGDLQFYPFYR